MTMDQQFVEFVVKAIVGNPDAVEVERTIDEKGVLLELTVDPSDLGRVIGKRGNTAQSIRTLLRALGTKNDARYNLKIVDNGEEVPQKSEQKLSENESSNETATDTDTNQETSSGNQWAHLSSSNDDVTETGDKEDEESSTGSTNETVEKTKKELADLDDLNI